MASLRASKTLLNVSLLNPVITKTCLLSQLMARPARPSHLNHTFNCLNRSDLLKTEHETHVTQKRMAGHAHWQNIAHTKTARDRQKATMIEKHIRMIRATLREPGGNDPVANTKLDKAIKAARQREVPVATIERALKAADTEALEPCMFELKGPGSCFLIIETLIDPKKRKKMAHDLKGVVNRIPLMSIVEGRSIIGHIFNQKGMIQAEITEGLTLETALDHAIEAGAEEVKITTNEKGVEVFEFLSDFKDFHEVCKNLEQLKYNVILAELSYVPQVTQELNEDAMKIVHVLFERLEDMPEIVKIHDNIA